MSATRPIGFWGLVVEPNNMYSQKVPVSFKISMATLAPEAYEATVAARSTLMLTHQKDGEFALCTLTAAKHDQQALDLVFLEGETIHLRVIGDTAVHLTGYYVDDASNDAFDCEGTAGYDSEELEAEREGLDIEHTDEEEEESGSGEECDSDDNDFIDDDEEDEEEDCDYEESDSADGEECSDGENVAATASPRRLAGRIREIVSDGEAPSDCDTADEELEPASEAEECGSSSEENESGSDGSEDESGSDGDEGEIATEDDEEIDSEEVELDADLTKLLAESRKRTLAVPTAASLTPPPSGVASGKGSAPESASKGGSAAKAAKVDGAASAVRAKVEAKAEAKAGAKVEAKEGSIKVIEVGAGEGIKAMKKRIVSVAYSVAADASSPGKAAAKSGKVSIAMDGTRGSHALMEHVRGMALGGERKLVAPMGTLERLLEVAPAKGAAAKHSSATGPLATMTIKLVDVQSPADTKK